MTLRAAWGLVVCGLGVLLLSLPASAYSIHIKGKHDERLAWLSEECWRSNNDLVDRCGNLPVSKADFEAIDGETFRQGLYWESVRWPDDPTRQLSSLFTLPKFGINAQFRCPGLVANQGLMAGLLCSSHHGNLQFLHAMRSSAEETNQQTRALIEDWSRFAFRVAAGAIAPDAVYCETIANNAGSAASFLAPAGLSFCHTRTVNGTTYDPWEVGTLFAFRCDEMFSSATCDVLPYEQDPQIVRRAATGALLHLIQDSFSQSHAARGEVQGSGRFEARIACSPVQEFYLYAANRTHHAEADAAPFFAENCRQNGQILDPVTAGAQLLHFINAGEGSEQAAIDLIMDRVIGGAGLAQTR